MCFPITVLTGKRARNLCVIRSASLICQRGWALEALNFEESESFDRGDNEGLVKI